MTSPAQLIASRVAALQRGDFAGVYATYHHKAPFRRFFPTLPDYLAFAAEHLAGSLRMSDHATEREEIVGHEAHLLLHQHFWLGGVELRQLEVVRCLRHGGEWRYHSGCKIDVTALNGDPATLSWDELLAAGDGVWI